jgi:hypothetical protein
MMSWSGGGLLASPSRIIVRVRDSISGTSCSIFVRSPASVT